MGEERHMSDRRRFAPQIRLIALVAVLALAWGTLLPLAHGGASRHVGDCGVCSLLAHGGASVADRAPASDVAPNAVCADLDPIELHQAVPRRDFDARRARAPPSTSVIG